MWVFLGGGGKDRVCWDRDWEYGFVGCFGGSGTWDMGPKRNNCDSLTGPKQLVVKVTGNHGNMEMEVMGKKDKRRSDCVNIHET